MRWRLHAICETYGLDPGVVRHNLELIDATRGEAALACEESSRGATGLRFTPAADYLDKLARGVSLVVVDNASDAFDANENSRRLVRGFVRRLRHLASRENAAVVLLAHIDKQAARFSSHGNSYSGSTAWHNSVRSRLALVPSSVSGLELRHEKSQYAVAAQNTRLQFIPPGILIPVSGSALVNSLTESADDESVLAALQAAADKDTNVPDARTGPQTTQHVLETFPQLIDELHGSGNGRKRFWHALGRLQDSGRVRSEEYHDKNRNARKRLVVG
jgi:RecA-family ATPase